MRDFFVNLFRDDTFGPFIDLFNIWHIIVLVLVLIEAIAFIYLFKNKNYETKQKVLNWLSFIIVALYFGDFFIHPLLEDGNYLIVDKLPFHLCTSAGILIAITRLFPNKTKFWHHVPTVLGLIGAIMYMTVPTGVAGERLICYRTIQTLLYHGTLLVYGILAIAFEDVCLSFKTIYKEAIVIFIQIVIALIANSVYSIPDGREDAHSYNWYFVKGGLFGLPISDVLMPFVIFAVFMIMACLIYGICYLVNTIKLRKKAE